MQPTDSPSPIVAFLRKLLPVSSADNPYEPITIANYAPTMNAEAEVVRTNLESEGIPCMLLRERAIFADDIRLQVRRMDAEAARKIIEVLEE